MAGLDIGSLLQKYDEDAREKAAPKPKPGGGGSSGGGAQARPREAAPPPSRAEEIASNEIGDTSRERQIRNAVADGAAAEKERLIDRALGPDVPRVDGLKIDAPEYQRRAVAMMLNATSIRNAQAVITISNRENIRKGLAKPVELQKSGNRGQTSTVTIRTASIGHARQEVGPLSFRASQNEIIDGVLYWFFGKPADVVFPSPDAQARMDEIVANLDLNASPARFSRLNYNMSGTLLDRLDEIKDRLDAVAAWMQQDMKEGVASRMQSDKSYIALCYLVLAFSALAPPVMPGQKAGDLDLLARGGTWDLMSALDGAYDYYRARNGREIYKAKHGIRTTGFSYAAAPVGPEPFVESGGQDLYGGGSGDDGGDDGRDGPDAYTGDDAEGYAEVDPADYDEPDEGAFGNDFDDFTGGADMSYGAADDPDSAANAGPDDPFAQMKERSRAKSIEDKFKAALAKKSGQTQ